jgi:Family of unknown function (DUF5372)
MTYVSMAASEMLRQRYLRVTHPFHPWHGRQFEFVDCRRCWGQWRVFYYTEDRELAYFPASWTDLGEADPFVVLSGGKAVARFFLGRSNQSMQCAA